ncbi:MAG: phosphonate ABC transporter ATP-binding protein [Bacteroidetes bacterium GWF2_42_66]|nr:MAG: phosphonate ABC transporter ATP-binding protein [Bacteroidetes bacterium GWA2_42_15]OFY03110.1 MAG: phosphonate ABC transporter ATP-binding protein [Bacteroidetes bacterium GWE2_42_39]OFY45218.1 MAG: phosphonate ABC transporter ATP-binding protein [Bacteroidetes bacterium GWF2_42_66]HBL74125.1 phosphonate ABC transporter ATP-binding protein [Prolixibacteraceae bacterium]HCR90514.1 phosphonate ABC transporter ATP-binding protein [Prolixibacteraceae bacterium]
MIHLNKIDKYYDSKFQRTFVLKAVNLEVKEGEFLSIMGPSGSGKSTLLNIIGLLDAPSAGEYSLYEKSVLDLKEKAKVDYHRNFMGFIFQAYHLIEEMTVYENIETPLIYKGVKSRDRQAMVADLLDRFNMVAKKDLFPQQLSGGQQQLVGIARAIVGKPKLLLADEPTGNLHSSQGEMIMDVLKQLNNEGMTIIQVTHNEKFAQCGKRIIRLEDGIIRGDQVV